MIKIYTTPTLDKMGLKYQELDATKEPDISTVPVTIIGKERIVGFDRPAIKKALRALEV